MRQILRLLVFPLILIMAAVPVRATTVESFSFRELVEQAELIFQGRVVDIRQDDVRGLTYTWVRFHVEEVVKGFYAAEQLELRFVGGETLRQRVEVSGASIPAAGERGIYFVDQLQNNAVNPLLGWSQGHFVIRESGQNGEIVIPRDGALPEGLALQKESALREKLDGMKFPDESLEKLSAQAVADLSPATFKAGIRAILEDGSE